MEEGTALARKVRKGELPPPDEDVLAEDYELIDQTLAKAGLHWYEVSNWAGGPAAECRHNLGYWRGGDWWGAGPGAHSHVGGVRWWNVKHPARYTALLADGDSPAAGHEVLTPAARHMERVMLELRLADGLALDAVDEAGAGELRQAAAEGLVDETALRERSRAILTDRGRLLADGLVRRLA